MTTPALNTPTRRKVDALRRERLDARLEESEALLKSREQDLMARRPQLYTAASKAIDAARAALTMGAMQVAWTHAHQAYRFLLEGIENPELEARAALIRREAGTKLNNWRGDAVRDLLAEKQDQQGQPRPLTGAEIALAQYLLDQYFENVYFKLDVLAAQARRMPWVLGGLSILVLIVSALMAPALGMPEDLLGLMLFGAVGAGLSMAVSALGGDSRIPEVLGKTEDALLRLFLGALSAVAVVAIVRSGILPIKVPEGYGVFVWALASGFSDQLLNRMMRSIEQSAEK